MGLIRFSRTFRSITLPSLHHRRRFVKWHKTKHVTIIGLIDIKGELLNEAVASR